MVIVNIKRWKGENNFVQIVKICKKIEKGTKGTVVNLSFLTQREIISLLLCYITYMWWCFVILIFFPMLPQKFHEMWHGGKASKDLLLKLRFCVEKDSIIYIWY